MTAPTSLPYICVPIMHWGRAEHLLGRNFSQQHVHFHRVRPVHSMASRAPPPSLLVEQAADRHDADRLWRLQRYRGNSRPSLVGRASSQRNGGGRISHLLGCRVCDLGSGYVHHRLDALAHWQGGHAFTATCNRMSLRRLGRHTRTSYGATLIWLGFGLLMVMATKPVRSRLVFGYEATAYDLLSLRCFGM